MRLLSIAFLLILSLNAAAQSSAVSRLFAEGTKNANQERFIDAVQNYKSALTLAENEYLDFGYRARLRFNIGACYLRLNDYDRAVENFKLAILLKKDYADARNALGIAETRRHESKLATASVVGVQGH